MASLHRMQSAKRGMGEWDEVLKREKEERWRGGKDEAAPLLVKFTPSLDSRYEKIRSKENM